MAKQAEKGNFNPYDETLVIHDRKTGAIKAISEFKDEGKYSSVDPLQKNSPAFVKIEGINPLRNWYKNFIKELQEPTQFGIYRVPRSEVQDLTAALSKLNDNPKDEAAIGFANKFEINGRKLDKIKIDKTEFPWDHLKVAGISPDDFEKKVSLTPKQADGRDIPGLVRSLRNATPTALMDLAQQGLITPAEINVKYQIGDKGFIDDKYSIQFYRGEDGSEGVKFNLKAPLATPEYLQENWRKQLGTDDITKLQEGKTLDRLFDVTDEATGEVRRSYIYFDHTTNRIVPVEGLRKFQIGDFVMGKRITDENKETLAHGGAIYLEGARFYKNGKEFSGKIQWDAREGRFDCYNPRYNEPNIPESLAKQLSAEDLSRLKNYELIDGTKYKNKEGQSYKGQIGVNRETNETFWRNSYSNSQEQTQSRSQGRSM